MEKEEKEDRTEGKESWHWNDMHEEQSEQGKRQLCHSL